MSTENTKKEQLGMSPGTASYRLVKDILFNLIKDKTCYHCGETLTRESFSIEHKVPWLGSENPKELFFDLENIDFSHLKCNISNGRRPNKKYNSEQELILERRKQDSKRWYSLSKDQKDKRNEKRRLRRKLKKV